MDVYTVFQKSIGMTEEPEDGTWVESYRTLNNAKMAVEWDAMESYNQYLEDEMDDPDGVFDPPPFVNWNKENWKECWIGFSETHDAVIVITKTTLV